MNSPRGINRKSFSAFKIEMCWQEEVIAFGTTFLYSKNDHYHLVTNWHNVAGRNPETLKCLSKTAALPNKIKIRIPYLTGGNNGKLQFFEFILPIYKDYAEHSPTQPMWFEHPRGGSKIDVVVIPFPKEQVENELRKIGVAPLPDLIEVNYEDNLNNDYQPQVGMDVFTLGFPRGVQVLGLPIWKRGSIASEPAIDADDLPRLFIDTATREGMSGSPIFVERAELRLTDEAIDTFKNQRFLGVYSGRVLGEDVFSAQLGIVWKRRTIDEIIDGGILGKSSFDISSS